MELVVMKRSLRDAEDRAGAVAMSESDREQFVEALQRLTASRAKHKERGDAAEAQLASLGGDLSQSRAAVATLTAQMGKLGNKMIELEEKKEAYKAKTMEQDRLMAAAVVRIKTLEVTSSGAGPGAGVSVTTSSGSSSSDCELVSQEQVRGAHIATAAASASAIVVRAAETMGSDYARVQQQYEEKSSELVAYRLQVEARDAECQQVLRLDKARRAEWDAQLAEVVKQLDEAKEALAEKTKAACALEDSQLQVAQTSITASSELGALQVQYSDLQQQLQSVQSSQLTTLAVYDTTKAELETLTRAHADSERRVSELLGASAKSMRDQASEREVHASEMKVMSELHEQLKANNIALETQLVTATSQVQELTERFNGGAGASSKSVAETGQTVDVNPVAVGAAAGAASTAEEGDGSSAPLDPARLSPGSENKLLKNTITALKQQEQVMFFALEDKLKDLDAARNRLVSLKKAAQRQKSDDLLSRLRRDVDGDEDGSKSSGKSNNNSKIMERMLNSAKQEQEKMHAKLISSEHENKELKIRLDSAHALLDKERKAGQELADELSEQRDDSEAEIARLSALVRKTIDDNQLRRSHEFEVLDSSIDTNTSMSPEKGRVSGVSVSSPGPSPIRSAGAVVNNTTSAHTNDNAAGSMDVVVEDVDDDDDDEDDMEFYDVGEVPDWIDG
jgi:hypothetical protein